LRWPAAQDPAAFWTPGSWIASETPIPSGPVPGGYPKAGETGGPPGAANAGPIGQK